MFKSLFTKSFIKEKLFPSVAQIILLVILFPFIAIIIRVIMPEQAGEFIKNTLEEIPIVNILTDYYSAVSVAEDLKVFYLFEFIIEAIKTTILSTYIVGLCAYIFKDIGELIGIRGIAGIQAIAGILAGCFCLKFIGDGIEANIICTAILMIIAFVITLISRKGSVISYLFKTGIEIGMTVITSATVSAYCVSLALLMRGRFESIWEGICIVLLSLIPATICLLIDYLLFGRKN